MIREKRNIRNLVHTILIDDVKARNSDKYLYVQVIRRLHPEILKGEFEKALFDDATPSYETVSRARRWVQEHFSATTASDRVQAGRMMQEEEYKEVFAGGR